MHTLPSVLEVMRKRREYWGKSQAFRFEMRGVVYGGLKEG
jgi:hypothetical protein